jgi:O-antigen/teichoic acid export membrane protein
VSTTLGTLAFSTGIGIGLLWLAAGREFGFAADSMSAVTLASFAVLPLSVVSVVVLMFLLSQEKVNVTSVFYGTGSIVATICTYIFVAVIHFGVFGAVLAQAIGTGFIAFGLLIAAQRTKIPLAIGLDWAYLKQALRLGVFLDSGYVIVALSQRLDQILVLHLSGAHGAGQYSIALSIGQLSSYAPLALALAAFSRLAYLGAEESRAVMTNTFRVGIAASILGTGLLLLVSPFAIPLVFGPAFRPAIVPTVILLPAGILTSSQWMLSRAAVARGRSVVVFWSYGLSLVVMTAIDFMLVRRLGPKGASIGSDAGSTVGFVICIAWYKWIEGELDLRRLLPRAGDFHKVLILPIQLLKQLRVTSS